MFLIYIGPRYQKIFGFGTYLFQLGDLADQGTISNKDSAANLDTGWKALVGARDDSVVTLDSVVGGDLKSLVNLEVDVLSILEEASSDLWALRVEHEGDWLVWSLGHGGSQVGDLLAVGLVVTVGEVETGNVHTSINHVDELLDLVASWSEGADDLGAAHLGLDALEDVVEFDGVGVSRSLFGHL